MTDLIELILTWGRQGHTHDTTGHFSAEQVERLRRYLNSEMRNQNRRVYGQPNKGYELVLPNNERVGVTNGYAQGFVIYYRQAMPAYFMPERKIPMTAFTADDGNSWGG